LFFLIKKIKKYYIFFFCFFFFFLLCARLVLKLYRRGSGGLSCVFLAWRGWCQSDVHVYMTRVHNNNTSTHTITPRTHHSTYHNICHQRHMVKAVRHCFFFRWVTKSSFWGLNGRVCSWSLANQPTCTQKRSQPQQHLANSQRVRKERSYEKKRDEIKTKKTFFVFSFLPPYVFGITPRKVLGGREELSVWVNPWKKWLDQPPPHEEAKVVDCRHTEKPAHNWCAYFEHHW